MESAAAMKSMALDAVWEVWQAAACPVRIACSRAVLEELALASSAGFNRLAKGGVEIGGVLFGVHDSDSVKILAYRALACEYAFGPSFTLSDSDRRALEDLLTLPNTDSNLSGVLPLGWFHSHTRSPISLSDEDLQLFQQYFPETWQIALVLRPHHFGPVRGGFFFRERDGSVQAASSRHEFVIKPLSDKPGSLPDDSAPSGLASLPPGPATSIPRSEPEPHSRPPRTASAGPQTWWSWRATTVVLMLAVALFWLDRSRTSAGLTLHELGVGGDLRIDWNHNARIIRQAESGAIEIEDGSFKLHHELSPEYLRLGSVTYLRTTGNVLVRLLVRRADQSTFTEFARFQGSPVAVAAPIDTPPAEKDRTPPPPVPPEPEREVRYVPPVNRPSQELPREATVQAVAAQPAPAASALQRRQLTLPPAGAPHIAPEPLLPAPPVIVPNIAATTATYVPHLPLPAPPKPDDQSPSAGKIIWTGKLTRGATVQILGNRASQGRVTGGLPGVPVRVQVFPSELVQEGLRIFTADPASIAPTEAPGAQNGWNRTVYVLNPRKAGDIVIPEAPGPQNAWNRIVLRAERGDHSIIVLRWERVAAEPSLHSRSNQ
jgi:hypothetical protein